MVRYLFPVTCKVALFNLSKDKVLVVEYNRGNFGLPGGHIDEGEEPDQALRRELVEELGLDSAQLDLQRVHFSPHPSGKIVLGYQATLDEAAPINIDPHEIGRYHWVGLEDIVSGRVDVGVYREIVLK